MVLRLVSKDARDAIQRSAHRGFPSTSISSVAAGAGFRHSFKIDRGNQHSLDQEDDKKKNPALQNSKEIFFLKKTKINQCYLVRECVGESPLTLERGVLPGLQHGLDLLYGPRPVVPVVGGEAATVARPLLQPDRCRRNLSVQCSARPFLSVSDNAASGNEEPAK
jgi:hypothetical protein